MEQTTTTGGTTKSPTTDSRIVIEKSLLEQAKSGDKDAMNIIFNQFLPETETIIDCDYYGYFGFWFVGFHSFACLTDKRLGTLRIGPFKKIFYRDAFYENMTSGAIFQPSLFWLYIFLFVGLIAGMIFIGSVIYLCLIFLFKELFGLYDLSESGFLYVLSGIGSLFLLPFVGNIIINVFYAFNPSGFACWVRERLPVYVSVNRRMMTKANRFYRIWSELKEQRMKTLKKKSKN
jgi:hypothetical protein